MSENNEPKKGDRVRVVLEGEVTGVSGASFWVGPGLTKIRPKAAVSVEKIADPLPTTPGSVVRWYSAVFKDGVDYVLTAKGWLDVTSPLGTPFPDGDDFKRGPQARVEVIFDAGKAS